MLCNSEFSQSLPAFRVLYSILFLLCISRQLNSTPVPTPTMDTDSVVTDSSDNSSSTVLDDDLYVIKAVVYEIGILTDADNTTSDSTEKQEEVKISFYNDPNKTNASTDNMPAEFF